MDVLTKYFTETNRTKTARFFFDIALLVELALMIAEKSDLVFSMESHVFRITFLLTLGAVLLQKHSRKEWAIILLVWVFTFACYRITGRNELLRFATFAMAARDIDLERTMKFIFCACLAGFGLIALLSVLGIMGNVSLVMDYGRENAEELRYVFGFGHPNTLYGCAYALILLWLWNNGRKAGLWQFIVLLAINVVLYRITVSRTGLAIGIATLLMAVIVRFAGPIKKWWITYVLAGFVTPVACVGFSYWAASVSEIPRFIYRNRRDLRITKLDELLNNRIQVLYRGSTRHGGSLESWKLFSDRLSVEYFDMGWVRLFYWYGIVPAVLICLLVVLLLFICYKKRDLWTVVILVSLSIYTLIEATFVSVYIGRNFMLPILGVYVWQLIRGSITPFGQENVKQERGIL